ncbi:MAG: ActS/PrrB/RegB family redox-sensitive histidine kinase [Hyphomicrobiaceae bacterium]|nr:ActS/PrrB/RegB family redox-sensitive histidine kinase [Hyphomicrobiaceae bacterium]MCC0010946.1 ActS/PrrB/RegB family redox-sensitive histidine kinase [Hyphomicrobiaceae bacterium]
MTSNGHFDQDHSVFSSDTLRRQREAWSADSRLRLQTIVWLRWIAVLGQLTAVLVVWLFLQFPMPVGYCLGFVALSAWVNVALSVKYPARHRFSVGTATALLAYDLLQLTVLLYLTGGLQNPFAMLLLAPVTVSAATLPAASTIMLGLIALAAAVLLIYFYWPLPWYYGMRYVMPLPYKIGVLAAVGAGIVFIAFYVWRLAREAELMSHALAATEQILAREQKLHALDGLAAAAAHELGTPLSTITLVTSELLRELKSTPHGEDLVLLRDQAARCREILQKLTRTPGEQDDWYARLTLRELVDEASQAYRCGPTVVTVEAGPDTLASGTGVLEPIVVRRPGLIYGLGNLIENAVDYAERGVAIDARWSQTTVSISIADDGPGFAPELIETLGEPYISTRRQNALKQQRSRAGGLGLGFFIAKTLLERSGAQISLENRQKPEHGAIVTVSWPRDSFERQDANATA